MNRRLAIGALVVIVGAMCFGAAAGQTASPARLKVNGVGLNSTYGQVVKALGKPAVDGKATPEECAGGREKTVAYAGLSFHFMDGDSKNKKTFEVQSFSVTSGNWVVSGVKIGDTATTVRAKYGRKYTVSTDAETGQTSWSYDMGDRDGPGTTTVEFKGGRVLSISSAFMVC